MNNNIQPLEERLPILTPNIQQVKNMRSEGENPLHIDPNIPICALWHCIEYVESGNRVLFEECLKNTVRMYENQLQELKEVTPEHLKKIELLKELNQFPNTGYKLLREATH